MNENEQTEPKPTRTRTAMPFKSYSFLIALSKKLGTVATKSFIDVRQFLNNDVPLPSAERFLYAMGKRRQKRGVSPSQTPARRIDEVQEGTLRSNDSSAKLNKVLERSHEILAGANTVFPITLFHDTVFVDRTKITIIKRNFFWSEDVTSIRIEDVLNVSASVGPLFGSLTIASRVMSTVDHFDISNFWRKDAVHLKHIIQGYVIALQNKLDVDHLSKEELIQTLQKLGHDRTMTTI